MEAPKRRVGQVVLPLQALVGRGDLQFHQEGNHEVPHEYEDQGIGEELRVRPQAVLDDLTGVGEIGDGGKDRSQQAQTHREPGHVPPRQEVLLGVALAPAEVVAEEDHGGQVKKDRRVVDPVKSLKSAGWIAQGQQGAHGPVLR